MVKPRGERRLTEATGGSRGGRFDGTVTKFDAAFAPVKAAIAEGRIPAAALGVVDADGNRKVELTGFSALVPTRRELARDALFDLASLTKVILSTSTLMRLVERGAISLDDPLSAHLPELRHGEGRAWANGITIRRCLAHITGLPATAPIYRWGGDADRLRTLILEHDWELGENVYSDINFILLGILIERVTGQALREHLPDGDFWVTPGPARAVATELCPWRKRVLVGEVHDENAFALGGLAGHAGLFGTVDAVLDFAGRLLTGDLLGPAAFGEMARAQNATRALGWQIRHAGWSGGMHCSASTIGHTGFTGTGLWIDLDRGVAWTLLTNRVHPTRHAETGIIALRQAVGDALLA